MWGSSGEMLVLARANTLEMWEVTHLTGVNIQRERWGTLRETVLIREIFVTVSTEIDLHCFGAWQNAGQMLGNDSQTQFGIYKFSGKKKEKKKKDI